MYDVIDGPEGSDASLRPNQLYAISLVDELVPRDRALQILRLVEEQLLTPVGLRTLSPHDPRYRARGTKAAYWNETAPTIKAPSGPFC